MDGRLVERAQAKRLVAPELFPQLVVFEQVGELIGGDIGEDILAALVYAVLP